MQHVFIVGAKGFTYGGYETFLDKLTEYHQNKESIKYHIACKANGPGMTDESILKLTPLNWYVLMVGTKLFGHMPSSSILQN